MLVRLAILMTATVLAASACGSDDVDTDAPTTTTTVVEPIDAAAPPASFAEIESDYEASRETLLAQGREAVDDILTNDPDALHARFDLAMAAAISAEELGSTLDEVIAQAPLTGRGTDRAFQQTAEMGLYRAELEWGNDVVAVTVFFNEAAEISDLGLDPQPPLPPDPAAGYQSEVAFSLPVDGLWFVFWGGESAIENYHVIATDQRHAYDIVVWKDGGTHVGDPSVNENYWAYGQRVLAPAAGTIVTAVDGLRDQTPQVGSDGTNPAGNHLVIEVARGEYVLIAHMQPGSLTVAVGDVVESGQQIGLVGNSGNTSEPHIHIHLQDQPTFDPTSAIGLPLLFTDYLANGQAVELGQPVGDQFIVSR